MSSNTATSEVLKHKGRRFRRTVKESDGDARYSPPLPSTAKSAMFPVSRSVMLPPPLSLMANSSKNRPISAKGRHRPQSLQVINEANDYRLQFALKRSRPLPPIPDQSSTSPDLQHKIYEVDSAVDLNYSSQCVTPVDLPASGIIASDYRGDTVIDVTNKMTPLTVYTKEHLSTNSITNGSPSHFSSLPSVLLGLKLPNGDRIQNQFLLTATLKDVVKYAEECSGTDLKDCILSTNGVPRTVFSDKTQTLHESGINVRTVLYFSFP